ncbi:MAG TPA: alpha/beta hydrolase [Nitriliruptorales bacterium]|nr:alpha/beta hydrolase [Nitriliruptorales bacterium]
MGTVEATKAMSNDGTAIAYWTTGQGPPLVLVHGTTSNHTTWDPLLPHLEAHLTVHAIDRRGRGGSGDAADYDLSREFEDVAAVIDQVAETSRSQVDLLGHSFGGLCAFGASGLTSNVRRLALYEGWPMPAPDLVAAPSEVMDTVAKRLIAGDDEAALETFYRQVVHMSEEELRGFRANSSWWQSRVEAAHTIVREDQAGRAAVLDPEQANQLAIPVLLLVGADSPDNLRGDPEALAEALPNARIDVLEGEQHLAHALAPEMFADRLLTFLNRWTP